ncbi:polysaccharide deacetylase family protein [Sphingobacterium wenxiniae]|uniref:polysaccharide deacetylase family protein n=1 Tax=Sphingobacterium wenxiniae TaxID=683125 RepID=UPI000B85359E|nr:polysaccharide deacetylase family protein [Sphingobacterium wenxiniae]
MLRHRWISYFFIAINFIALLLFLFFHYSIWWFVLTVGLGLGITAWGAFDIRLGYFTDTFYRRKHSRGKVIALTFDDGPTHYTEQILDLLQRYQASATFFCIGKQVEKFPELAKRLVHEGHTIGNHTFSHSPWMGFYKADKVLVELQEADSVIEAVTGKRVKFFRPPYGVTNPSIAKAVKLTRHQVIGWSNRSLDTIIMDEDKLYNRVVRKLRSGDIVLFHDTSQRTVKVLERLLPYLQEEGYGLVTVDDLLTLHAYES